MLWAGFWKVGAKPLFQIRILLLFKKKKVIFVIQTLDVLIEDLRKEERAGEHFEITQESYYEQRSECDSEKGRPFR